MSELDILLGFEVGSGEPVLIQLHHLVITGMTELSGKTTTIEALIQRSGLRAIVFKTKRGEKGFERVGRVLPLYFKERSDWQYVSSLIEATLREKMKFERSWIIRACKGTKTLREVYERVKEFLKKERLRSLDRSIFTNLQAYLDLVLPSIKKLNFTDKLDIGPGVNVMDLEALYARPEVQALIIRSVMEYILEYERDIIVVVPECWKFLPQARGSPVKVFFERFIREGATINNYLWLDSQDIAGVDKTPLRQVDNWILGRQKETHEVERTIDAIPLPKSEKPKPLQIRRLKVGHFIAACGNTVKLVYVLPAGVPEDVGRKVALGKSSPEYVRDHFLKKMEVEDEVWKEKYEKAEREKNRLQGLVEGLKVRLEDVEKRLKTTYKVLEDAEKRLKATYKVKETKISALRGRLEKAEGDLKLYDELRSVFRRMLPQSAVPSHPKRIDLKQRETVVKISHTEEPLKMDTKTQKGRIMFCAIKDLSKEGFTIEEMSQALDERGWHVTYSSLNPTISSHLVREGILIRIPKTRPAKYRVPGKLRIEVEEIIADKLC